MRNPKNVKRIDSYKLPTDKELAVQTVDYIICETCYLNEQCNGMRLSFCMRPQKELAELRKKLCDAILLNFDDKKKHKQ